MQADPFVDDQALIYISDVDELLDPAKARTAIEGACAKKVKRPGHACVLVDPVGAFGVGERGQSST